MKSIKVSKRIPTAQLLIKNKEIITLKILITITVNWHIKYNIISSCSIPDHNSISH